MLVVTALAAASPAATKDPRAYGLKARDLPAGFALQGGGVMNNVQAAETGSASLAEYERWGRTTGYFVQFGRKGTPPPGGAIQVLSTASIYRTVAGARASMQDSRANCGEPSATRLSIAARIGDERVLCSFASTTNSVKITEYALIWRRGTVKSSIITVGLRAGASQRDAIALARKQDARMASALES
jgi:hypothetical protein